MGDTAIILGPWNKNEMLLVSMLLCCAESLSRVQLFVMLWTAALQAPLSLEILQARILEWVAMPSSRGSSQARDGTQVSRIAGRFFTVGATREARESWSGEPLPPPGELPNPETEPGLLHCRWMLYQLSYQGIFLSSMPICKPISGKELMNGHGKQKTYTLTKTLKNLYLLIQDI